MEEELKEKLDRRWKYLNSIGINTREELYEYDRKTVINIGVLGLTPEELKIEIERWKAENEH